jgi:hypothetical protein
MTRYIIIETNDRPRKRKSDPMMERSASDYLFNYKPAYKQLFGRGRS